LSYWGLSAIIHRRFRSPGEPPRPGYQTPGYGSSPASGAGGAERVAPTAVFPVVS